MGSCCFTPSKSDFLWWYWLLLASVVGIPMLLAVCYITKHKNADEEQKEKLGKNAIRIFWAALACMITTVVLLLFVVQIEAFAGIIFVPAYIIGMLFLKYVDKAVHKDAPDLATRLVTLLLFLALWWLMSYALWFFLYFFKSFKVGK